MNNNHHTQKSVNETVVFGGGCFWCTEAVFSMMKGISSVVSGYAGGESYSDGRVPTYEEVSNGTTGHVEVIKIEYDSKIITFKNLLSIFFGSHDPTTLNKQGNDVGTQYRSVIFYTTDDQKKQANEYIAGLNASAEFGADIVTEVAPLEIFYGAEEYHKDYYAKNPQNRYCEIVINPKLQKAVSHFEVLLKENIKNK